MLEGGVKTRSKAVQLLHGKIMSNYATLSKHAKVRHTLCMDTKPLEHIQKTSSIFIGALDREDQRDLPQRNVDTLCPTRTGQNRP
jgi:hypothetical protein